MKPIVTIAGVSCGVVSIAIALPEWIEVNNGAKHGSLGLWRVCATLSRDGEVTCLSLEYTPGWIKTTAGFEVAGICVTLVAVLLSFLHICIAKNSKVARILPVIGAVFGGSFMILGVIIWAAKYKDEPGLAPFSLAVGFILAIVSAILSIIAGILLLLGLRAEPNEQPQMVF